MFKASNIKNIVSQQLIDQGLWGFYSILHEMHINQKDFKEYFYRFTERTMCEFFSRGLLMNLDFKKFRIFHELGVSKSNKKWGRIDLLIEDINQKTLYFIECKSYWGNENEPEGNSWKEQETKQYYSGVLEQAESYSKHETIFKDHKKVLIALVFDRIKLNSNSDVSKWHFSDVEENEFYSFETYDRSNEPLLGIATYGMVKELH